ncbi:18195_t:CDS:2, partial [Acaulospora morrowiae]
YSSAANETLDDITVPTSRFLMQCNDLGMHAQTLDENYSPEITGIYDGASEFYPMIPPKSNDDYAYVNATTCLIPMIPTSFVTHETSTSPSLSSCKKSSANTIHSPTPSLITDDEQDPQQQMQFMYDFQLQAINESFNNPRQQPSPDFHTKGSSPVQSKQLSPDLHDNHLNIPNQQLPSPVSTDSDGLGIDRLTPPPSHQTTPKQKKRRVSKKSSLNSMNIITESQQTRQHSNIFTTINTRDLTDGTCEYDVCDDSLNNYVFPPSASSSRRSSVCAGTKRKVIDDSDETPEERRRKFLERNRIAASKCRQKKKAAMQELKERADAIGTRNASLHGFVNDLREELLTLKNQLLAHRNCNCNILQEYIRKDAHANAPATATQKN